MITAAEALTRAQESLEAATTNTNRANRSGQTFSIAGLADAHTAHGYMKLAELLLRSDVREVVRRAG